MATYPIDSIIQGRYKVIQALSGGMGIVYICVDEQENGFPVALKTFQDRFISSSEARDRFLREATVWIQIGYHPNIVQAYNAIRLHDQSVFLILQLIPPLPGAKDASLRSILRPGSPMRVDRVLQLGLQICRGMSFATSKVPGLVHRDLKPENILIAPDGAARITDFGLVTVIQSISQQNNKTTSNLPFNRAQITQGVIGTPLYMSPEQWATGSADTRSDIYTVGLILLEAIIGSNPFDAHSIQEIVQFHLSGAPLKSLQMSNLQPVLKQVLTGFLHPDPASRLLNWATAIKELTRAYSIILGTEPPIENALIDVSRKSILLKAESFLAVGASYIDIGKFSTAEEYFSRTIDIAKEENSLPLLALAFGGGAIAKAGMGENQAAIPMYSASIDIYLQLGFVDFAGNDLANMGNSYFLTGDNDKARQCLLKALKIAQEAHDTKNVARCQANLANIDIAKGNFSAALSAFQSALDIARQNNDIQGEAKYLAGLALTQERFGDNSAAINSYMLAFEKAKSIADRQAEAGALIGAGNLIGQSGDVPRGLSLLEDALSLATQLNDRLTQSIVTGNLGMLYLKKLSFEKAQKLLEESLQTATEIDAKSVVANANWALGLMYEVKRQFYEAIIYQRKAVMLFKELGLPCYAENSRHLLALRKELGLF